jgi:ABC-type polysaccharide/polyol phosphate transport system ATPase subunit
MDEIAAFSELGEFLNLPVRYYSAGMVVRLGFSIATAVSPQILIIDEVLSAGDRSFQERASERVESLVRQAAVVVLVSHDLNAIARLCQRVIWMDHGRIVEDGPASNVISAYARSAHAAPAQAA